MLVDTIRQWLTRIEGVRASCAASGRTAVVMLGECIPNPL